MSYTHLTLEKMRKELARRYQIVREYAITSVKFSLPSELHHQTVDAKYKPVKEAFADLEDPKKTRETQKDLEYNLTTIIEEWKQFEEKSVGEITLLLAKKTKENPELQREIAKHVMVVELLEHELHEETSTPKAVASLILKLRAIESEAQFADKENHPEAKVTGEIPALISSLQSLLQHKVKSPTTDKIAQAPYAAVKKFLFEHDVQKYNSEEGRNYFAMAKEVFSNANKRKDADYLKLIKTHGIHQPTIANSPQSFFAESPLKNHKKEPEGVIKRKPSR